MRAHLKSSPIPLVRGADIEAACQKTIPSADFLAEYEFDLNQFTASRFTLQLCSQCLEVFQVDRYNYALAEGQAVKDLEAA